MDSRYRSQIKGERSLQKGKYVATVEPVSPGAAQFGTALAIALEMPKPIDSTFRPALLLAFGRGVALTFTFFIPVLFARLLTPAEFGTYKQLFLIHATIYGIGLGLAESLFYFLPSEPEKAGRYTGNSIAMLGMVGLAGFVVLGVAGRVMAHWLSNPLLAGLAPLIGCYLALTLASAPLEIVMIARGRHRSASLTYILSDFVRSTLMLAPVLIWPRLDVLLFGSIGFAVIRLAGSLASMRGEFRGDLRPDATCLRRQLVYSLPLQVAVALQVLQVNFHQYVVSMSFDPATFAIYAVGCLQIPLFEVLAGPVCSVMMVQMAQKLKESNREEVLRIWSDTTRKLAFMFFPMVVLLLVVSEDLITFLFTSAYGSSVAVFRVWVLSFLLTAFLPHGVLRAYGDTRFLALQNLLKLLVVGVLIHSFISLFGLLGAVLTAVLAVLAGKCMLLERMRRLAGIRSSQLLPWRSLAETLGVSVAASLPALAVSAALDFPIPVRLISIGGTYLAGYVVLMWSFFWRFELYGVSSFLDKLRARLWVPTTGKGQSTSAS